MDIVLPDSKVGTAGILQSFTGGAFAGWVDQLGNPPFPGERGTVGRDIRAPLPPGEGLG